MGIKWVRSDALNGVFRIGRLSCTGVAPIRLDVGVNWLTHVKNFKISLLYITIWFSGCF